MEDDDPFRGVGMPQNIRWTNIFAADGGFVVCRGSAIQTAPIPTSGRAHGLSKMGI